MTPTATLNPLSDFSDRLSPMVVKELRQGLRTRMFALVMLFLHGLLLIVTFINGANAQGVDTNWMLQGLSILCLCVIMPLRGFSAVADEIHRNTLDMLVLTRLSAVRIVFGKWLSIALQSLLIALSLMPYVVASYVYGGTDLIHELEMLGLKWLVGIVIASAVVCLSTQRQFGLRAAVVGLALIGPGIGSVALGFMWLRMGSAGPGMASSWPAAMSEGVTAFASILMAAWMIFAFLSLAATRIAPAASNLAVVKRPVHVGFILIIMMVSWLFKLPANIIFAAITTIGWFATLDAMVERENVVSSTLTPFYRRGLVGRLAALVLTNGWPSGLLFSLLLTLILSVAGWFAGDIEIASTVWLSVADVWLCATLLHLFIGRRVSDLLAPYIGIALFLTVVKMFVAVIAQLPIDVEALWLSVIFPGTVLSALEALKIKGSSSINVEEFRAVGLAVSCLWPICLGLMSAGASARARPLREEARYLATGS
jgi:hypothetical protein